MDVIQATVEPTVQKVLTRQWHFQGFFFDWSPCSRIFHSWRRHHSRWSAECFDLCSTLMAIEQWELLNVPHLLWHGTPFIMVISKDLWHSHLSFSGQRYLQHPIKRKMCFSSLNFSEYWLREEVNSSYLYHTYSYLNFKWKLLHMIIL